MIKFLSELSIFGCGCGYWLRLWLLAAAAMQKYRKTQCSGRSRCQSHHFGSRVFEYTRLIDEYEYRHMFLNTSIIRPAADQQIQYPDHVYRFGYLKPTFKNLIHVSFQKLNASPWWTLFIYVWRTFTKIHYNSKFSILVFLVFFVICVIVFVMNVHFCNGDEQREMTATVLHLTMNYRALWHGGKSSFGTHFFFTGTRELNHYGYKITRGCIALTNISTQTLALYFFTSTTILWNNWRDVGTCNNHA